MTTYRPLRCVCHPRTCALILLALGCGTHGAVDTAEAESESAAVACTAVLRQTLSDVREFAGAVDTPTDKRAMISAQAAGRVLTLKVAEGDHVEAGALLATIEAGPLADRLMQARAHASETALAVTHARVVRDRTRGLVERGIAPRQEIDDTESHLAQLEEIAASARAGMSEARGLLAHTRVVAPFAGVVIRVLKRPGEIVDGTSALPILELADVSQLELVVAATSRDLVAVTVGVNVTARIDGLSAAIAGTVRMVSAAVDPQSGAGTIRMTLQLPHSVPLGVPGHVTVQLGTHVGLVVPATALRSGRNGTAEVLLCRDGHATPTVVEVGQRLDGSTEIVSGLQAQAEVVIRAIGIEDGATAAPQAPQASEHH